MARVLPFPALLSPLDPQATVHERASLRALFEAPDPDAELGRWRASGVVLRDSRPALYLLDVAQDHARESVRYLICALMPDAPLPLELEPYRPRSAHVEPAVTFVADDFGVLRETLAHASERSVMVGQGPLAGRSVTLRRIDDAGVTQRIQSLLDETWLRPLVALSERGPSLAAVVPLSAPALRLEPVHRAVKNLATFRQDTFLRLVSSYARVYELDEPLTSREGLQAARERLATLVAGHHAVLLVLPEGKGRILRFRQGLDLSHLKAAPRNPTLRSLDLALLNAVILRTVLGVQDPQALGHPQVFNVDELEELVRAVNTGTFQVGFGLNPPPLWEVRAVMEAGATLPARTLRVEPAPPPGVLFLDTQA